MPPNIARASTLVNSQLRWLMILTPETAQWTYDNAFIPGCEAD